MAETKPGIVLNENNICQACYHHEMRDEINYGERYKKLENLANKYRSSDGAYDCIVPVSGGKDSHFAVHVAKRKLDLNPLLIRVKDPYSKTEAGKHNIRNLIETYDCDIITTEMGVKTTRKMTRIGFEEFGYTIWPEERCIQAQPIRKAIQLDIPFIIYGENTPWEYGGTLYDHDDEEPYHAKDQIKTRVAKDVDESVWLNSGVTQGDLNMLRYPDKEEIEDAGLEPIFLSYFMPWDGYEHYRLAKRYGFKDLSNEWNRDKYIEDYDQIDTIGYILNGHVKYAKYGFSRATDTIGYWRRSDHFDITINEAKKLIEENDPELDQKILEDFLDFTGYSHSEFWEIFDSHRNEELFEKSFIESDNLDGPKNDFENIDLD